MLRKMQHCALGEKILQTQAQNLLKTTLLFDAMSSSFLRNLGVKPRTLRNKTAVLPLKAFHVGQGYNTFRKHSEKTFSFSIRHPGLTEV